MSCDQARCARCRQDVGATIHTAAGFQVRGFRMLVGRVQVAQIQGREDGGEREYLRIVDPRALWLCPGCAAEPAALADLDADWSDEPAS